jgi:hypothetical protein
MSKEMTEEILDVPDLIVLVEGLFSRRGIFMPIHVALCHSTRIELILTVCRAA